MANNGAYVCDVNSPQTLRGKKRFEGGLETTGIEFEYGVELTDALSYDRKGNEVISLVSSNEIIAPSFVGTFEGDGSQLENISFENFSPAMRPSRNATNDDLVLLQQKSHPKGISKVSVKSFFSLLAGHNGSLFEFVNGGKNVGGGAQLCKGVTVGPREVSLNFRTINFSPNFKVFEEENEVIVVMSEEVEIQNLNLKDALVAPRIAIKSVKEPVNGMIAYDTKTERFYGFAKNKWIALHRPL
jgi:hypothetical protein